MTESLFTQHLSVSITPDMDRYLEELARVRTRQGKNKPVSKAQLIREAIRLYLDQQADLHGSRRQIAKSLEARLVLLTDEITGLAQEVALLNEHSKSQDQQLLKLRIAFLPLMTWLASHRSESTK
jgi:Ribbon-helix-helix protein, copG family